LRRLQRGNIERRPHGGDLLIAEDTHEAWKPAAERVDRFAGLQDRSDLKQILDHGRWAYPGERPSVGAAPWRGNFKDRICRGELKFPRRGFDPGTGHGFGPPGQGLFEFPRLVRRTFANQPLPHRQQRCSADLARPQRNIAFDQERLKRTEQQTCRIVGARPRFLDGSAHDLAQLFEHEIGDGGVFAAFDGALELSHQQRLRLWRQLCEIIPQPFG